jgi:hypothetical protein
VNITSDRTCGKNEVRALHGTVAHRGFEGQGGMLDEHADVRRGGKYRHPGVELQIVRNHGRGRCSHGLVDVAGIERWLEPFLGRETLDEYDPRGRAIRRRRAPFHQFVDRAKRLVGNGVDRAMLGTSVRFGKADPARRQEGSYMGIFTIASRLSGIIVAIDSINWTHDFRPRTFAKRAVFSGNFPGLRGMQ